MRIGIDMYPQLLFNTGVRVVIDNLLNAFKQYYPEHAFIELRPRYRPFNNVAKHPIKKIVNHFQRIFWTQVELNRSAENNHCDLLFCTCHFSPFVTTLPTVTLFYDLAIWRHPEWYPQWWVMLNKLFAQLPAQFNCHLITISEDARQDVIAFFKQSPVQVTAIHLGVDLPQLPDKRDRELLALCGLSEEDEYIFHLGLAAKHKNLPNLVKAFAQVCQLLPQRKLKLVLAGPATNLHGRDELSKIQSIAQEQGIDEKIVYTGFISRESCVALYRNAVIYAFPSLFEGFGLPMIEAMASGTPVVASYLSSLPEIGGDAAIYFNPHNPQSIAQALYLVLTQPALHQEMVRRGRERADMFTWQRTAKEYVALFEKILKSR